VSAGELQAGVGGALRDGFELCLAGEQKARVGEDLQFSFEGPAVIEGKAHGVSGVQQQGWGWWEICDMWEGLIFF
jgi:hypothetical protein